MDSTLMTLTLILCIWNQGNSEGTKLVCWKTLVHIDKGKAYGRQGKAKTGLNFIPLPLLLMYKGRLQRIKVLTHQMKLACICHNADCCAACSRNSKEWNFPDRKVDEFPPFTWGFCCAFFRIIISLVVKSLFLLSRIFIFFYVGIVRKWKNAVRKRYKPQHSIRTL